MEQAIDAYYTITASEEFREIARMRERARHNEASALYHAKQETMIEAIRSLMKNMNLSIDQAMAALNISDADFPKYREKLQPQ